VGHIAEASTVQRSITLHQEAAWHWIDDLKIFPECTQSRGQEEAPVMFLLSEFMILLTISSNY